jgi:hypothetical protein
MISVLLIRTNKKTGQTDRGYTEAAGHEEGRVAFWMKYLRRKSMGIENLNFASYRMKELGISVLAYKQNLTSAELEAELDQGKLVVPEELQSVIHLQDRSTSSDSKPAPLTRKILSRFRSRHHSTQNSEDAEMGKLVQYLEAQLEIKHDDGNY